MICMNGLFVVSLSISVGFVRAAPATCDGRPDGAPCTLSMSCDTFGGCSSGFSDSKCYKGTCLPLPEGACHGKSEGGFCGNCHTCETYGAGFCYHLTEGDLLQCTKASVPVERKMSTACSDKNPGDSCDYEQAIYGGSSSGAEPIIRSVSSTCSGSPACPPGQVAGCYSKNEGDTCDNYEEFSYSCHRSKCQIRHYRYSGGKCYLSDGSGLSCSDADGVIISSSSSAFTNVVGFVLTLLVPACVAIAFAA